MPYKDPAKKKEYYEKNKEKYKERATTSRKNNYGKIKEYYDYRTQNAIESITSKCIIDRKKWNQWCNQIKSRSTNKKHPYSDDFSNDIIFEMMIRGCFYCGDIATTIDRLYSNLNHTIDNCVGCCYGCNNSKGAADPSTFVIKSYYKARGKYYTDVTDVWFENKNKPSMWNYKRNAKKKGIRFDLTEEKWNMMIVDKCEYCNRSPTTWFGVDRIVPENGYVDDNVVTCCFDCNVDKHEGDVETMTKRNERIARRVDDGDIVIEDRSRMILHIGTPKSSKRVCAYGKVYESQIDATRALKKGDNYVCQCILDRRYPEDIFYVNDDFYDFVVSNKLENITKKMYLLFDRM